MRSDKRARAMAVYTGGKGPSTLGHVMSTIPDDLAEALTGKQLGQVMNIRNAPTKCGLRK